MKYRLRRYESGTMCRMALAYTPELQIYIYRSIFTTGVNHKNCLQQQQRYGIVGFA